MRIICTVSTDLVYDQRMQRICSALDEAGHEVLLIGRQLSDSLPLSSTSYRQRRIKTGFQYGPLFYIILNVRFFLLLLFARVDVVYAVDHDTVLAASFVKRFRRIRFVYDAHEWFEELPELQDKKTVRSMWSFIGRTGIDNADLCITVNQALSEKLAEVHGKTFETIRNVPVYQPVDIPDQREKVIIYQGALNKGRKLEILISAMRRLPDWTCWLVGEGDLSEYLRKKVREMSLEDRIVFFGRLKPDELKQLTPKASLGYNLLDGGSLSYYYSLSNKFFDYMHAAVPSLNPAFPAYERIVQEYACGVALERQDETSLVETILALAEDSASYERHVSSCLKVASKYSWQSEKLDLIHLIEGLNQ